MKGSFEGGYELSILDMIDPLRTS